MAFLIGGANSASGGYEVSNSLRFDNPTDDNLAITFGSAGNRKTFTISAWVKRSALTTDGSFTIFGAGGTGSNPRSILFFSSDAFRFGDNASGSANKEIMTNALFRDPSAWYHIVVGVDTTQATDTNRFKMYVNGVLQTSLASATYPDEDADLNWNNSVLHTVGRYPANDAHHMDGYMSEFYFIDGTQYAASDFGEYDEDSGIWIPKAASVTFGDNGFFLEFKQTGTDTDAIGMGADTSGEDNHLAVNNLTAVDVTADTPTNNFATLNPLVAQTKAPTYSQGNLKFDYNTANSSHWAIGVSTVGLSTGKWYWEVELDAIPGYAQIGILGDQTAHILGNPDADDNYVGKYARGYAFQHNGGNSYNDNSSSGFGGNNTVAGDINNFALDMDNHKLYYGINGTWQNSGDPTSGSTGTGALAISNDQSLYFPAVSAEDANWICNFGNPPFAISSSNADADGYGNFEHAVPSGYFALCTKNLAEYG
tara:strand:+ start:184 stop:1626 length:1443 start_codon:yes stop_codon:yes gene_type:complete